MAHVYEPTEEMKQEWGAFVTSRPDHVRIIAERFYPWTLYRIGTEGHRVIICSFQEHKDGSVTLTVDVLAKFNFLMFERQVFGVKPEELTECDLPCADEIVGCPEIVFQD